MTARARAIEALASEQVAIFDDCLASLADIGYRQTARAISLALESEGRIQRAAKICGRCGNAKLTSELISSEVGVIEVAPPAPAPSTTLDAELERPWFWEGNIQSRVVDWLAKSGYKIISTADTAARTPGKDIVATDVHGVILWVSVKGWPERSANIQARHWFAGALFDLVVYRDEDSTSQLAIALPDGYVTYRNLADRVVWLKQQLPFKYYWASVDGSVREE